MPAIEEFCADCCISFQDSDRVIKVHQFLLKDLSYFQNKTSIRIEDCSEEIVTALLKSLYVGRITLNRTCDFKDLILIARTMHKLGFSDNAPTLDVSVESLDNISWMLDEVDDITKKVCRCFLEKNRDRVSEHLSTTSKVAEFATILQKITNTSVGLDYTLRLVREWVYYNVSVRQQHLLSLVDVVLGFNQNFVEKEQETERSEKDVQKQEEVTTSIIETKGQSTQEDLVEQPKDVSGPKQPDSLVQTNHVVERNEDLYKVIHDLINDTLHATAKRFEDSHLRSDGVPTPKTDSEHSHKEVPAPTTITQDQVTVEQANQTLLNNTQPKDHDKTITSHNNQAPNQEVPPTKQDANETPPRPPQPRKLQLESTPIQQEQPKPDLVQVEVICVTLTVSNEGTINVELGTRPTLKRKKSVLNNGFLLKEFATKLNDIKQLKKVQKEQENKKKELVREVRKQALLAASLRISSNINVEMNKPKTNIKSELVRRKSIKNMAPFLTSTDATCYDSGPDLKHFSEQLTPDTDYYLHFFANRNLLLTCDLETKTARLEEKSMDFRTQCWKLGLDGYLTSRCDPDLVLQVRNGAVGVGPRIKNDAVTDADDIINQVFDVVFCGGKQAQAKYLCLKSNNKMILGNSLRDQKKLVLHVLNGEMAKRNRWALTEEQVESL
ncbi:BTB/POZ domain-containing protein [Acrasis kona]|uniref:BTB/POZ domain-containing protein n=1 Tax=Acrasis kona TaxID=1008807 RepID=A0AAW2ZLV6_9EUKA